MQNSNFKIIFFIATFFILSLSAVSLADTLDISKIGIGARTIAMGRTQIAALDLPSIFINPANAAVLKNYSATSMFGTVAEDAGYSILGVGIPGQKGMAGNFGISYIGAGVSDISVTSLDASSRPYAVANFNYSSKLLILSYGREFSAKLLAGASLKCFSKSFEGLQSGSGYDLDVGCLYYPREGLAIGVVAQNLLPSGLSDMAWGTNTKEDINANYKIGLRYDKNKDWLVLADYDGGLHLGVEWQQGNCFSLRGGVEALPMATNFSLGAGIKKGEFSFDYAYYLDSKVSALSSHYFSIGIEKL